MSRNLTATLLTMLTLACGSSAEESPPLRAFGNEPFWNVTISSAEGIVYGRMGAPDVPFPYDSPGYVDGETRTRVFGPMTDTTGEHEIEIRISDEDCQDTMADVVHPMRATVIVDGEELSGCARRLDIGPGTQTPQSSWDSFGPSQTRNVADS